MSFGSRLKDLTGPSFLLLLSSEYCVNSRQDQRQIQSLGSLFLSPAICEVDRSVFLMGSVIRAWQGLGGLKLSRLMAEQTAQSQAALPMSFAEQNRKAPGFCKLCSCPEKPLVCCLCLSYWVFPFSFPGSSPPFPSHSPPSPCHGWYCVQSL